jgi:hypothetical protein
MGSLGHSKPANKFWQGSGPYFAGYNKFSEACLAFNLAITFFSSRSAVFTKNGQVFWGNLQRAGWAP